MRERIEKNVMALSVISTIVFVSSWIVLALGGLGFIFGRYDIMGRCCFLSGVLIILFVPLYNKYLKAKKELDGMPKEPTEFDLLKEKMKKDLDAALNAQAERIGRKNL